MALEALAAEVRAVLGAARRLVGSAPQRAELSADNTGRMVGALDVQQHDVAAGQWSGRGHSPMVCACWVRHQRPREWRARTGR